MSELGICNKFLELTANILFLTPSRYLVTIISMSSNSMGYWMIIFRNCF